MTIDLPREAVEAGADTLAKISYVVVEVQGQRARQDQKWGEQNHPDGTGTFDDLERAHRVRTRCQARFAHGSGTWRDVLDEEIAEAYAEADPGKLRARLLRVAAGAVAWVEAIDRRPSPAPPVVESVEVPDRQEVQG